MRDRRFKTYSLYTGRNLTGQRSDNRVFDCHWKESETGDDLDPFLIKTVEYINLHDVFDEELCEGDIVFVDPHQRPYLGYRPIVEPKIGIISYIRTNAQYVIKYADGTYSEFSDLSINRHVDEDTDEHGEDSVCKIDSVREIGHIFDKGINYNLLNRRINIGECHSFNRADKIGAFDESRAKEIKNRIIEEFLEFWSNHPTIQFAKSTPGTFLYCEKQ